MRDYFCPEEVNVMSLGSASWHVYNHIQEYNCRTVWRDDNSNASTNICPKRFVVGDILSSDSCIHPTLMALDTLPGFDPQEAKITNKLQTCG
jgi:hypothetical protein